MQIAFYPHVHEMDELFENTIAKEVHSFDMSPMRNIVYNFVGDTKGHYVYVEDSMVTKFVESTNAALLVMYKALDHFMESDDPEKYQKLGIENQFLIKAIEHSYRLDEYVKPYYPKLQKFCNGLYGNFDATVDKDGKFWFYEYNGNTPVMTYESIVIQDKALQRLGYSEEQQFNLLFEYWVDYFKSMYDDFGKVNMAFSGFAELVCDMLTVDTMCNAATLAGHNAVVVDLREDLEFENLTNTLHITGHEEPLDFMFTLFPWEDFDDDSLITFNKNYERIKSYGKGTLIAEPPYKVVLSNKAFLAYVHEHFHEEATEAGIIPSFTSSTKLSAVIGNDDKFITKPIYGRLSANIRVYDGNGIVSETEGEFEDNDVIFQPFVPLVDTGMGHVQLRMWVAPNAETSIFEACGFAVRKSNSAFSMETETEEFLPHVIVEHLKQS